MYQPDKYKNNDPVFIHKFIQQHPFATIVVQGESLLATHVPVLVDENSDDLRLYAHIANHNPMFDVLKSNMEMLLIFNGPDAYISSSWYEEPDIPTWDYSAVHVNAKVEIQTAEELRESLHCLINHFEEKQQDPMTVAKIPLKMWQENFSEITGFWLDPIKSLGIEKLHQGFKKKDIENIASHLEQKTGCPMQQLGELIIKENKE